MDILLNDTEIVRLSQIYKQKNPAYSFKVTKNISSQNTETKSLLIKIGGTNTIYQSSFEFFKNQTPHSISTPQLLGEKDLVKLLNLILSKYNKSTVINHVNLSIAFPLKQNNNYEVNLIEGSKNHPLSDLIFKNNRNETLNKILSNNFNNEIKFNIINDVVELTIAGDNSDKVDFSLIVGTGINSAQLNPNHDNKETYQEIAVFEPGYYNDHNLLAETISLLDKKSQLYSDLGDSLFELETAGYGLYKIFNHINHLNNCKTKIDSTHELNRLADSGNKLAQDLFIRSAQLLSAHLIGRILNLTKINSGKEIQITINVSGSVVIHGFRYLSTLSSTIKRIIKETNPQLPDVLINFIEIPGDNLSGLI